MNRSDFSDNQSQFGDHVQSTMRPAAARKPGISRISASLNAKSNSAKFSSSRSTLLVRGMTTIPCCHQPPEADLRRRLPVGLADFLQYFVAFGAAARDRAVGNDSHLVLAACGNDLVLIQERMAFDLIADQGLARNPVGLIEQRNREIRYAICRA